MADDKYVYLRDVPFSKDGLPREERVPHLFTLTDFLDDSWTHRSYWVFADRPSIATGCSGREKGLIFGRLLVHDDATVWGYGRKNVHWSNEFSDGPCHLFSRGLDAAEPAWSVTVPIQVRAMVRAGDTLFVAGPSAAAVEGTEPATGRQDALLLAYSADAGKELGRWDSTTRPYSTEWPQPEADCSSRWPTAASSAWQASNSRIPDFSGVPVAEARSTTAGCRRVARRSFASAPAPHRGC